MRSALADCLRVLLHEARVIEAEHRARLARAARDGDARADERLAFLEWLDRARPVSLHRREREARAFIEQAELERSRYGLRSWRAWASFRAFAADGMAPERAAALAQSAHPNADSWRKRLQRARRGVV